MVFENFLRKNSFATDKKKYTLFTDRDILRLVIPLFFEQLLFILVGSADTVMVAGLGEASISAVSLVNMFSTCIFSIIFAISTGGAVVVYIKWLESKIDYNNAEYGKYNNSSIAFNNAYSAFERYYNRQNMPIQQKLKFF